MKIYIERADGSLARIMLPDEEYEDVWEAIKHIATYRWDNSLDPVIAAELDSHIADCPFCGGRPHVRLIDGLYIASVECGCGAVYMCKDCTGSVTETLERYSRRIK